MRRWWPAEYERHWGCILLFPKPSPQTAYCGAFPTSQLLENAQNAVLDVITAIVMDGLEDVYLFCDPHDVKHQSTVVAYLQERKLPFVVTFDHPTMDGTDATSSAATNVVHVMLCPSEDTWARDTGPTFVMEDRNLDVITGDKTTTTTTALIGLDWEFNAYGGKDDGCYWPYAMDEQIAFNMIQSINQNKTFTIQHEKIASLILEGGSIHTDGEGTILTTKECLLHTNRNPHLTQDEIERIVLQATGCTKMIWLDRGLAYDDDTNGHIDNWACFVKPGHVVLAWTDDIDNDPINYHNCRESLTILQNSTDAHDRALTIHKLYLPSPPIHYVNHPDETVMKAPTGSSPTDMDDTSTTVIRVPGTQMAASYVNFYIANEAVIVPQFDRPICDQKALELLKLLFTNTNNNVDDDNDKPDGTESPQKQRTVVGINSSRHILYGGGNIHCITQQIPKV